MNNENDRYMVTAPGDVLEAVAKGKDQGKIRYIGVTSHIGRGNQRPVEKNTKEKVANNNSDFNVVKRGSIGSRTLF